MIEGLTGRRIRIWRIPDNGVRMDGPLLEGEFLERPNRFLCRVGLGDRIVDAHLRDPGRLKELLIRGRKVYLTPAKGGSRKTKYDLVMVCDDGILVSVDSTLPNRLIHGELSEGRLAPFRQYKEVRKEVRYGRSRFDFLLTSSRKSCYLEVKSATLVVDGTALFPDAVTARGTRHVRELLDARRAGHEAVILFVVQREDALRLAPHDEVDPAFGRAIREAVKGGVGILAYSCKITREEVRLERPIEVNKIGME